MEADNEVLDAIDFKQKYADDVMRHMTVKVEDLTEEPSAILRKGDDRKRRERR
jgi:small subunit ribosomal protein S6